MNKFKKIVAAALTATLILGNVVTAFAADTTTSANNGGTSGNGTSEGHVNKHVTSVVLPTVADGATPFAYTMDLERLVQETNGAKYDEATFPEKGADTGVYFLTGENKYENTSQVLTVSSQSSADVTLKVEVKVVATETDVELVSAVPSATASQPQLYLALQVGSEAPVAVLANDTVSKVVTIAGVPTNFETIWDADDGVYKYAPKADATGWNTTTISIAGAASKASAEGLTAPTLQVTWSWTDPEAATAPVISNITEFTKSAPENVVITFDLGSGTEAVEADKVVLYQGTSNTVVNTAKYTVSMSDKTITIDKTAGFLTGATADVPVKVVLMKGEEEVKAITGTITIK